MKTIILVLLITLFASVVTSADDSIKLLENKIGPMNISHGMPINSALLSESLKPFSVARKIGEQDGPDYVFYEVKDNGNELFWINTEDEIENKLFSIYISDKKIIDQYGVSIGISYQQIKSLRSNIKFETGDHFHTYAYVHGSNIAYEISGDFEGPDRKNFTEQEIANWTVRYIVWLKLKE